MKPAADSKSSEIDAQNPERLKRRMHRKDTTNFIWGTWLMLFLAVALGHDTLHGFRTGEWIDLGTRDNGVPVPWWLAAPLALGALLLSLWCFVEYVKLKLTAPTYQPGDERD